MKKTLTSLFAFCLLTSTGFTQNLINKVPVNASLVVKYSGIGLSQKLTASKFDSYTALKNKLFDLFKLSKQTTLSQMGLDLDQDAYQFLVTTDTTSNFVTIVAIKDAIKFNKFIQTNKTSTVEIQSKKGFQMYTISPNAFVGWDGKFATVISTTYSPEDYYNRYYYYNNTAPDTTTIAVVTTVDSAAINNTNNPTKMDTAMISAVPDMPPPIIIIDNPEYHNDSVVNVQSVTMDATKIDSDTREEIAKRAEEVRRDSIRAAIFDSTKKALVTALLFDTYNVNYLSIEKNNSYAQLADKNADINVWIDSSGIYNRFFKYNYDYNLDKWLGCVQGINIYFEPNQIRIEQKILSGKDSAAKLLKQVLNNKQDPALANYVHPSDIGYLSMSINTEAMLNYYYLALKKILPNKTTGLNLDSSLVDVYVDLMQIVIDEKGIADMVPGNSVFILHDLKSRQVKYTSYDYDKEYNSIPVQKTKTELSPDFCIVFTTKNEKIFNKLVDLPIKLHKHQFYDYTKTGDFYTLKLGPDEYVDKLYFKVKNGQCIITTSLQDVTSKTYNQSTTLDANAKQSILNDNYSAKFNVKNLVKGLATQITDSRDKKRLTYLQKNISDITFKSTVTPDAFRTTTILTTAGNHNNSFEYLFDVLEAMIDLDSPVN